MALQSEVLCQGCPQRPGYTHVSRLRPRQHPSLPPRPSSGESARSLWGPRPAPNAEQGEQHGRPWALGGGGGRASLPLAGGTGWRVPGRALGAATARVYCSMFKLNTGSK